MQQDLQRPSIRAIGAVNWIGLATLYSKEVQRFLRVFIQTVLAPVVQTLLFMAVLALAWGQARGEVLGVPFTQFLGPGLVMMAILGNAFQNSSSSLMVAKMQGISVDFMMPPLSAAELTAAFVGGAATRGLLVGAASFVAILPFTPVALHHPLAIVYFAVSASVMMGAAGMLAGVWAQKFDHIAAVGNFVITPLTFLSGTFYSVAVLPDTLEMVTRWNPFFHLIDGFRYGFIGQADGGVLAGAIYVGVVDIAVVAVVYLVMKSGWRMKS
ncbi:MAG: ABC transporter permease [Maricaulaceae bacterium]|jgi:ABC-2 type transport system permease protein